MAPTTGQDPEEAAPTARRLREAENVLAAIREGRVDAFVIPGACGSQVQTLQRFDDPYRIFVEQMEQGAATVDADGTILYCNARLAMLLGVTSRQLTGSLLPTFVEPEHRAPLADLLANQEAVARQYEMRLRTTQGITIPARLTVRPLQMEEAMVRCVLVTDLTEQQRRREEQAAREAAEASNRAKDDFLATLSHELRAPLTPVLLTASVLENEAALPDAVREDVALIRRNVERQARLVDDLLDLTRIVHGKLEMHPAVVDLHAVVAMALEVCRPEINARRLDLHVVLHAADHFVYGDSERLEQVFWNLIRNAVKFTPAGGRILVRSDSVPDGSLHVAVTDSGVGLSSELRERIFRPFEQGHSHLPAHKGGLGLGLAISRAIVENHGGHISVYSGGPGEGATFTVTLLTAKTPACATITPERVPAAAHRVTPLRILLVEDHDDTRRSMERILTAMGHSVQAAGTVKEAMRLASLGAIDLLLSDLGLPDGDGCALMRELKQRGPLRGVCISGYGMEQDRARSVAAGFITHLTKPISLAQLEAVLRDCQTGKEASGFNRS